MSQHSWRQINPRRFGPRVEIPKNRINLERRMLYIELKTESNLIIM